MVPTLRIFWVTILLTLQSVAVPVEAGLYPHDSSNDVYCESCHTSHQSLGSRGYDNMCLACHKPGSPGAARKFPFSPGDAANPYKTYTSNPPPGMAQTSHTWVGSDTVAKAGALPPKTSQMVKSNLVGALSCVKCHNIHAPRSSATNSAPFLRMLNDRDQMCLDCHRPRNTRDTRKGTHPVNFNYTSATSLVRQKPSEFLGVPMSSNPANPTAAIRLKNGTLVCTTCHGVHYTDSDRTTFDSRTSVLTASPLGKGGYLLRTNLRGTNAASLNMCTNCHIKPSHNKRGQDVQCGDCHGGHVDGADGTVPNVYVVRRYMNISTQYGAVRNKPAFLQSTSTKNWRSNDALKPGVCQACHSVPTGGSYPPEHASTNGKVCMACHVHNSPTGAFSASCSQCHGFPPSQNVSGGPNGYAENYFGLSGVSEATSPHATHAGGAGNYSFGCSQCHQGNNHSDGNYQDVFRDTAGMIAGTAGAAPSYNTATRQCSNLYCHSNGNPRGGALVTATVTWPNGTISDCSSCHAGMPGTNAHTKHLAKYSCHICHAATVEKDSFTTIADRTKHVNAVKDVIFANTTSTAGGGWNGAAASCATIYCHSQGTAKTAPFAAPLVSPVWTSTLTCAGCHGDSGSGTLSGEHQVHVNNPSVLGTANSFGCVECHAKTVSSNTVISSSSRHVNRFNDYSGTKAGKTAACGNFYCHSNGNVSSLAYTTPPAWTSGASLDCNGCHGTTNSGTGAPDYASGGAASATANSHNRHVAGAGMTDTTGCANCHYRTVDAAVAGKLRNYSTLHLNKTDDVAFKLIGGKTGTYSSGTMQCSNTYCHGAAASPQWGLTVGVPLACNTCHGADNSLPGAHSQHWESATLAGSYTMPAGNSGTTTAYQFACSSCHLPGSAVHAGGPANANGAAQVYFGYTAPGRSGSYTHGANQGSDNGFGWTNGTSCATTYCHSNGNGGAPANTTITWTTPDGTLGCTGCHGNAASNTLSGKHQAHVNNAAALGTNNSFGCVDCHAKTVSSDTVLSDKRKHVNKFKDYSGGRALGSGHYFNDTKQCLNIYCHSNGNLQSLSYTNPPAWNTGSSLGCSGCHGTTNAATGAPDYASGGAASATDNSHNRHVAGAGITDTTGCANCHYRTADAAVAGKLRNYSTLHLNKMVDVAFRQIGGKSGTYNSGTAQCSSTYCHGTAASPQWGLTVGVPLACNTCHAATAIDAGWNAASAHKLHWEDMVLPSSYTMTPGNSSSDPSKYRFACSSCHAPGSSTAVHAAGPAGANGAGQVFFGYTNATRKGSYTYGGATAGTDNGFAWTAGTNCNTTYCHSNGQTGAGEANGTAVTWSTTTNTGCTACHGSAASNTLSGKHQAHVNNAAVLGTNFTCNACHAKTVGPGSDTALSDKRNHVNKFVDYSGARAGKTASCSNFYCHSNGKGTYANPPAWTGGGPLGCNGCHGKTNGYGAPDYASGAAGSPTANSHARHAAASGDCMKCHQKTTLSGSAIVAGSTKHVDGAIDVRFSAVNGFTIYSGVYDAAAKTCSATYCHGSGQSSPAWGTAGPLSCDTCHKASNVLPAGHGIHYADATAFTVYTSTPGNRSTAGAYRFACSSCHGRNAASHAAGPVAVNSAANIFFGFSSAGRNPVWTPGGTNNTDAQGFKYTSGTNAACNATYCHSNGQGGNGTYAALNWATPQGSIGCTGCHGNAASGTLSGEHANHVNNAAVFGTNNSFGCVECHAKTVSNDTTIGTKANHVNKFRDYSGAKANDNYVAATKTCTSVYCHSNGNLRSIVYANPPAWNAGASLGCNGCHGTSNAATGAPDYASGGAGSTTSNSHDRHVAGAGITNTTGCATCHARTVRTTSFNALRNYSTLHLNKVADVSFKLLNGKTGMYDQNNQQCSATYCHGAAASPKWGLTVGVPLACNTCHSAKPDDAYWAANSAHKVHLEAAVLPSKYVNYSGNVSSAGSYRFTCSSCHLPGSGKAVHAGGLANANGAGEIFFGYTTPGRVGTYTYGTTQGTTDNGFAWTNGTNCTTSYCHSNGTGGNGNTAVTWTTTSHNATATTRCKTCHGYTTASGTAIGSGTHTKHINGATYGFSCARCHNATTADGSTIADKSYHVNKAKNVTWDAVNTGGSAYNGGCTNIYCHSAGTANAAPYAAPNMAASWGGGLGTNCLGCHKGAKVSADPIVSGSHVMHISNYGMNCVKCHAATVSNATTIGTPGNHVNKFVTIAFNNTTTAVIGTAKYNGSVASVATPVNKTPGSAYGQCTNTYCHSTVQGANGVGAPTAYGTPTWGASQACSTCHRGPSNHMGTAADGTSGLEIATGSHTRHLDYNFTAGGIAQKCGVCHKWDPAKAVNDCAQCHTVAQRYTKHVNGVVDVAFDTTFGTGTYNGTGNPGDAYSNCSNVYCHSNGTSVATGTIPTNNTVNWGTAGPLACNSCHGNATVYTVGTYRIATPIYASGSPKGNAHSLHVDSRAGTDAGAQCVHCHSATTTTNTSIASTTLHVNKAYNLAASGTYLKGDSVNATGTVVFTYSYNASGSTCTNVSCHPTGLGQAAGVNTAKWGAGATAYGCSDCHNVALTATTSYHHAMRNYSSTYQNVVPSGSASAGTNPLNRRCTMCHVDHSVFSPGISNGAGTRAGNLRTNITSTTGTASDFIKTTGVEGICISCHKTALTKDSTRIKTDGNATTVAVTLAIYSSAAHQYNATSTMVNGGATFNSNCSKCHNGRTGEGAIFQNRSTAVHNSTSRHVLGALGAAAPAEFQEENFCYRCHSKATDAIGGIKKTADANDWYGAKTNMQAASTAIYQMFQKTNKHAVASYSNKHDAVETAAASFSGTERHVECEDCHNPHQATATAPLRGATGLDPTTPAAGAVPTYTVITVTDANQQYKVCFKCHTDWAGYGTGTTNLAVDFNTANDSFHWVEKDKFTYAVNTGTGRGIWKNAQFNLNAVPGQGTKKYVEVMMPRTGITYDNATLRTLPLRCSDCHGSNGADGGVTVPEGPHGSTVANILKVPSGSPYTTWNATTSSLTGDTWCLNCHDPTFANSGFRPTEGHLYGGSGKHQRPCQFCHLAIPHGSGSQGAGAANQRKHLLKPTTFGEGIDSETSGSQSQHGSWVIPGCT